MKSYSEIHLSRDLAELEKDVLLVWEPPDIYQDVFKDNIWLVYGRKGSGKSHLIDYLSKVKRNGNSQSGVVIVRPREDKLFQTIMSALKDIKDDDERIIIEKIASILEFVVIAHLMRKCVDVDGFLLPGTDKETVYNFLVQNNFHNGSVLAQSVNVLTRIMGGQFKIVDNLILMLSDNKKTYGFSDAKFALWRCLKNCSSSFIICIDDIDEIGFSFSRSDRYFVNALIVLMVRLNLEFSKEKHPLRVLLTTPSELFFHSSLWGDDWVETKSRCLRWTQVPAMQKIVNKRIAGQLNIKKSNPLNEHDIYSDANEHTWNKLLPSQIVNKVNRNEPAFTYILRHTFYTPRQVLDICDRIFTFLGEKNHTYPLSENISAYDWSCIFQTVVEDYTLSIHTSFLKLYGKIYDGIEEVLSHFKSKPAIWTRGCLSSFVDRECLTLTKIDSKKSYQGDSLIDVLQQIGFLGLGTKDLVSPSSTTAYNMRFSFLEKMPKTKPWEIAAISPVFLMLIVLSLKIIL